MSVKQFEKWEYFYDMPEEVQKTFEKGIAVDTAKAVIRWYISQQPEPAGEPKLTDHWDDIPLRLREKVNRLMEANRFAEAQGMLFAEGIREGWRQAMEQKPALPAPSPANGWGPLITDVWVDSLAGNIVYNKFSLMNFAEAKEIIKKHVAKHGLPVQSIEVSPKVVEQHPPQAGEPTPQAVQAAVDYLFKKILDGRECEQKLLTAILAAMEEKKQ